LADSTPVKPKLLIEVRFHGRGGQGVVIASLLLAKAAFREGKYVQAIPFFGAERRGAPVVAYTRISSETIYRRSGIKKPDIIVVLDPALSRTPEVFLGIKEGGLALLNANAVPKLDVIKSTSLKLALIDATSIAHKLGLVTAGIPITNTVILGALSKASQIVNIDSVIAAIAETWSGELAEKNIRAAQMGFESVKEVSVYG